MSIQIELLGDIGALMLFTVRLFDPVANTWENPYWTSDHGEEIHYFRH